MAISRKPKIPVGTRKLKTDAKAVARRKMYLEKLKNPAWVAARRKAAKEYRTKNADAVKEYQRVYKQELRKGATGLKKKKKAFGKPVHKIHKNGKGQPILHKIAPVSSIRPLGPLGSRVAF